VGCIDLTNTAILGFFDGDEMRGAAELRSMRNVWCDAAEAAFSVEAQWRSQGIGGTLMMDTLAMSHGLGVERVHLICERHNLAMLRIAEKVCADIRFEDGDCVEREDSKHHHGARDAANFGITLSANRRRLSREP
jgi:RimJ/RimL family protein N-acetyltransferase